MDHYGYRAVHMVVERDGTLVEIQLVTTWQQEWATLVEDIDGAYGLTLKDDEGADEVLGYLRLPATAQEARYAAGRFDALGARQLNEARQVAVDWLTRRGVSS